MYKNTCVLAENVKNSRLLALFSTLEERDKDIVISMSESLVERCKNNLTKTITDFSTDNEITSVR
jgi:hypothetical protein